MEKLSFSKIFGFCGSCIAFYIGAGFATMQEVMQYEVSYGSAFYIVILIAAIIYVYTNISFANCGNNYKLTRGGDIYSIYCGKYIGKFFDYFSAIFCYMCFIVMCGGANSTAMQQWKLPNGIGAIVLSFCVVCTVIFGLEGILKTLSKLGPIIIFSILIIAVVSLINNSASLVDGMRAIDGGKYQIEQVGNGNPFASGASYGGFVILWFASFLAEIGAKNKLKEVNIGMVISAIIIFSVASICCFALIANIDLTWNVGIPALVLAYSIHPCFAFFFSCIIYLGIYTSAVPLLWTGVRKVSNDGSKRYKLLTIIGGCIGCIIACYFPYKGLLNILYGLNGYLGFLLIFFMVLHNIKTIIIKRHSFK